MHVYAAAKLIKDMQHLAHGLASAGCSYFAAHVCLNLYGQLLVFLTLFLDTFPCQLKATVRLAVLFLAVLFLAVHNCA